MFLSSYERQYINALKRIYENGFSDGVNERTGLETKRLPGIIIQVDVETEFPILKSKFVAAKTSHREIEWIWKFPSNNIKDLKAHIWDDWADKDGSIGKAYGYQGAKPVDIYLDVVKKTKESFRHYDSQIEFVIEYLREIPNGRWGVMTLWNPADLSEMGLVPCCHTSTWNLDGGRLNCVLDQRSGDMPYGVPFNTTQYAQLMVMIARDLGVKPGLLTHVIADAHIYANQMEGVKEQLTYFDLLASLFDNNAMIEKYANSPDICVDDNGSIKPLAELSAKYKKAKVKNIPVDGVAHVREYEITDMIEKAKRVLLSVPTFVINSESTNFFSYTAEDCKVEDYANMGKVDFGDVAV